MNPYRVAGCLSVIVSGFLMAVGVWAILTAVVVTLG